MLNLIQFLSTRNIFCRVIYDSNNLFKDKGEEVTQIYEDNDFIILPDLNIKVTVLYQSILHLR